MNLIEGSMRYESGRIAVIVARFNSVITNELQEGALEAFKNLGVPENQIDVVKVPGSFELPVLAKLAATSGLYQGVLALGAVIRGKTDHFEHVSHECARGLQEVAVTTGIPVAYEVLATDTFELAKERSSLSGSNVGASGAFALIETMNVCRAIRHS